MDIMNTTNMTIPSNRVSDIENYCHKALDSHYGTAETAAMIRLLFDAFLGWDTVHFLLHRQDTIDQSDLLKLFWAVEELKKERPIQYVIGYTTFCGCTIKVNESVLIPRPETEAMVDNIIEMLSPARPQSIIDLGTGSGCIAVALSKAFPTARVEACDISEAALTTARRNAAANHADIAFYTCDLLSPTATDRRYDLIVSNPPYICDSEKKEMRHNVLDYEPHRALFVPDDDPLLFYRAIGHFAHRHLTDNGLVVMEINEMFGNETRLLFNGMGFEAKVGKDFRDRDRYVYARHKSDDTDH